MQGLYETVAARIRANCPAVMQVETGQRPEAAAELLALGPDVSALVTPLSDTATPIREFGIMVSQQEMWRFGVTLALVFPGGFPEFEPARDQIKATLRGWAPEGASMPVEYVGSQLISWTPAIDGGRHLHLFIFRVPTQVTYEHQS